MPAAAATKHCMAACSSCVPLQCGSPAVLPSASAGPCQHRHAAGNHRARQPGRRWVVAVALAASCFHALAAMLLFRWQRCPAQLQRAAWGALRRRGRIWVAVLSCMPLPPAGPQPVGKHLPCPSPFPCSAGRILVNNIGRQRFRILDVSGHCCGCCCRRWRHCDAVMPCRIAARALPRA